jgi:hypothetical protein
VGGTSIDFIFVHRVFLVLRGRAPKFTVRSLRQVEDALALAEFNFGDDYLAYWRSCEFNLAAAGVEW